MKNTSTAPKSPQPNMSRKAELKKNNIGRRSPSISIEKRMPINIFNIKNVNYLNSESSHQGTPLFRNEVLRENTKESSGVFDCEHSKSVSKSLKNNFIERPKSHGKPKRQRNRKGNSFIEISSHLLNRETMMTEESVMRSRPKTPNHNLADYRKKSMDSKSLISMIAQVNKMKHKDEGIKKLFQKITKSSAKDSQITPYLSIVQGIKSKYSQKNLYKNSCIDSNFFETSKSQIPKDKDGVERFTFADTENLFRKKMETFTEKVETTINEFKKLSNGRIETQDFSYQTELNKPAPIAFCNINSTNLIKEYSRNFMLSKNSVNPKNENCSGFFQRIKPEKKLIDNEKQAIYKEIFSLAQEHTLVEESLRILQEKDFDLELLFMAAYEKLKIKGKETRVDSARDSVIPDECANASGASFDSFGEKIEEGNEEKNLFSLEFDRLNKSITED